MNSYNYKATEKDFLAIEASIEISLNPKLSYIFNEINFIDNLVIITYDSNFIYILTRDKFSNIEKVNSKIHALNTYKIRHSVYFSDDERLGWHTGGLSTSIEKLLPPPYNHSDQKTFKIFGSLLGDYINTQKKVIGETNNPYSTQESYMATIIHELGHVYFQSYGGMYWNNNKKKNLADINCAYQLYRDNPVKLKKAKVVTPGYQSLSELFAFCTDYSVAVLFWPNHKKDLDKYYQKKLKHLMKTEKTNDLNITNSIMDNPHNFACIIGKILLSKYPKSWPIKILKESVSVF